jgi:hypothetical protein
MAACGPKSHEYSWGFAPPLWHPHYAIVMNYLYGKSDNFR